MKKNPDNGGTETMQTKTKKQFTAKAEKSFRHANPDAAGATIEWEFIGPMCDMKGAPGKMRNGYFLATADGYGTVRVFVSDGAGFSVRPGGRVR